MTINDGTQDYNVFMLHGTIIIHPFTSSVSKLYAKKTLLPLIAKKQESIEEKMLKIQQLQDQIKDVLISIAADNNCTFDVQNPNDLPF